MVNHNLNRYIFQRICPLEKEEDIKTAKNIFKEFEDQVLKKRKDFSHYNIVRMREAIRYFSPEKLEIFIRIPVLLHINAKGYPGYVDSKAACHGIWSFENSGFFKEAAGSKIFPKSIIETIRMKDPYILGLYHIGSLGTFTQSAGSDFDYWVIIDKKRFDKDRYENLKKKLDLILEYARETFSQEVTFFIMDAKEVKEDCYASFEGKETLSAPRIFLKEEFYRTFLMIAGKIPLWAVLPDAIEDASMSIEAVEKQVLSMNEDLIDLGRVGQIPKEDILKGLLWHVCKSEEDPVKALIKATMIFSYGFGDKVSKILLCDRAKARFTEAGVDDYTTDPYKLLFDRILEFHAAEDPESLNLIKNAIFFRLCEYPEVKMPKDHSPKWQLLNKYIREWKLSRTQIGKLLTYTRWSESEKQLLEKTIITRLARMYNYAMKSTDNIPQVLDQSNEKGNWVILKNKIKKRLNPAARKAAECSTFLRRQEIVVLVIKKVKNLWKVDIETKDGLKTEGVFRHITFLGIWGWILGNQLYARQHCTIRIEDDRSLFETGGNPVDPDRIFMAFAPLKPLSDEVYEKSCAWSKMSVLLVYDTLDTGCELSRAELLVSNTWGELFYNEIEFDPYALTEDKCSQVSEMMSQYDEQNLQLSVFQLSQSHDPDIVYLLKKAYTERNPERVRRINPERPYLDRL